MTQKKWGCYDCGKDFKTKKELVEHLKIEFDEATQTADTCCSQLDDMGIKNPYDDRKE